MSDNLYPNDGQYFSLSEPQDQKDEKDSEQNDVLSLLPTLKDFVKRMDDKIAFYKSVDSIDDEQLLDPEEFMHVIAANKLVAKCLTAEREYFKGLMDEYVQKL